MKNLFIVFAFGLFSISILMSCNNNSSSVTAVEDNSVVEEEEMSDEIIVTNNQFELAKMKLGKMESLNFPMTLRSMGKIEIPVKNQIKVSAYAGGYVKNISLIPDERVRKGQVLFTLENPQLIELQQAYLEAKEQLTYLQSDYERQKTLTGENVSSKKKFLKAESDYRVTLAKMEGMKKRLSLFNINTDNINAQNLVSIISVVAPSSGYLSEVHATNGMYLNPTDVAVEINNTDHLHLELSVFEKDILKIKKGQKITFTIPDSESDVYEAKVHLIGKTVDEEKRVVRIHAHLMSKKAKSTLVAGMYVDAAIILDDHQAMGVPESAIIAEDDKNYLLINNETTETAKEFEKKLVILGKQNNGFVEIKNNNDFTGEENILIEGGFNLIGIE